MAINCQPVRLNRGWRSYFQHGSRTWLAGRCRLQVRAQLRLLARAFLLLHWGLSVGFAGLSHSMEAGFQERLFQKTGSGCWQFIKVYSARWRGRTSAAFYCQSRWTPCTDSQGWANSLCLLRSLSKDWWPSLITTQRPPWWSKNLYKRF